MGTTTARSMVVKKKNRRWVPYAFIGLPALYLALFAGFPLLQGLRLSLTDTRLLNPSGGSFVGLENYSSLIGAAGFWQSVGTTVLYSALVVIASLALGTAAAVLINRPFPGRTLVRGALTIPWAVPTVAVALVFQWIYNDNSGILTRTTTALGMGQQGWLTDPEYGLFSVVLATVWKVTPFVMLVVLAALQGVPEELYEAAKVDGADMLSTFKAVALPVIMPALKVVALLMTIWSFRRFEIIWLLTGGGPADATNTIVINVYRQAFNNSQLGMAAALGMLGLVLSLLVTVIYFIIERRSDSGVAR